MMKKEMILSMLMLFAIANLYATVWTVNNAPNSGMQFSNLQEAIDAVQEGDTLYVSGSFDTYGSISINKEIHLIGSGYNPIKQASLPTKIGSIQFDTIIGVSGASNSSMQGIELYDLSGTNSYTSQGYWIENIFMNRNRLIGSLNIGNIDKLIISNSIIDGFFLSGPTHGFLSGRNIIIHNNIFNGHMPFRAFDGNPTYILCYNNVFFGDNQATGTYLASNHLRRFIFNNNIFYGMNISADGGASSIEFCEWSNNISFGTGTINFLVTGINSGQNNLEGVDPLFVNCPGFVFDFYTYDLHLQANSPAIGAGINGTDMGIYGGPNPHVDGGMVAIPQITEMSIINNTIPQNETLEVEIKAHSQQ